MMAFYWELMVKKSGRGLRNTLNNYTVVATTLTPGHTLNYLQGMRLGYQDQGRTAVIVRKQQSVQPVI